MDFARPLWVSYYGHADHYNMQRHLYNILLIIIIICIIDLYLTLNHKVFDDSMECATSVSITIAPIRQLYEVFHSFWYSFAKQGYDNPSSFFSIDGDVKICLLCHCSVTSLNDVICKLLIYFHKIKKKYFAFG